MKYQIEMYSTENYADWDDARKQGAVYSTVLPEALPPETTQHYMDHACMMNTVLAAVALTSKCLLNDTDVLRLCVRQI